MVMEGAQGEPGSATILLCSYVCYVVCIMICYVTWCAPLTTKWLPSPPFTSKYGVKVPVPTIKTPLLSLSFPAQMKLRGYIGPVKEDMQLIPYRFENRLGPQQINCDVYSTWDHYKLELPLMRTPGHARCQKLKGKYSENTAETLARTEQPEMETPVLEVKSMICSDEDLACHECEILFCGRAMKNDKNLNHYNVGPETVLHVISRPKPDLDAPSQSGNQNYCRNSYLTGMWLHRKCSNFTYVWNLCANCPSVQSSILTMTHPCFYVFCKRKCENVRAAKLRVRCATCDEDSIVLDKDPGEWSDVLRPGQITGFCFSKACAGDQSEADFYFKCKVCGSTSQGFGDEGSCIPLTEVNTNTADLMCTTCFESHDPVVKFPCDDNHVMCLDCFEQYARSSMRERLLVLQNNIGLTIACPEKCEGSFLRDTHLFHTLGIDEYNTYQALAAEECLFHEMKGIVCPNPECGSGLYPELPVKFESNIEIRCTSCGYSFCSTCRERYHGKSKCFTELSRRGQSGVEVTNYMATIKTIKQISKACPNCKAPTERNGGCMHMTCRMCKYEWCWNCMTKWSYDCQGDHWFV